MRLLDIQCGSHGLFTPPRWSVCNRIIFINRWTQLLPPNIVSLLRKEPKKRTNLFGQARLELDRLHERLNDVGCIRARACRD